MEFKLQFKLDKETKGAVRYQEIEAATDNALRGDDAVVGTLYIRKQAFAGEEYPQQLTVTIASGD